MAKYKNVDQTQIKNVVTYIRVSSSDQIENFSLETQQEDLMKLITYKGYNLVEKFKDPGVSGKNIIKRPDFQRMIEFIKERANTPEKIDCILVWKLSRFSRNSLDLMNSLKILEELDCHLMADKDSLNTFNEMGRTIIKLLGIFAELERDNIANNVKAGMKTGALQGHWMGGSPPYGYKTVPKTDNKASTLAIHEEEAQIVQQIFTMYAEGKGYAQIAKFLNLNQKVTTRKGSLWTFATIQHMLDNPVYIGQIRYGSFTDWNKNGRKGLTNPEDVIKTKGLHESIISEKVWSQVRAIRQERGKKSEHVRETKHLLSGLILCPTCGTPMVANNINRKNKDGSVKTNRYYQCGRYNNSKSCKPNLVLKDAIDSQVKNEFYRFIQNPKLAEIVSEKLNQNIDTSEFELNIEKGSKEIRKLTSRIEKAYDLLIDNEADQSLSDEMLKKRIQDMQEQITELQDDIDINAGKIDLIQNEKQIVSGIVQSLQALTDVFDEISLERQKSLLKYFIKSIHVFDDEDINRRSKLKSINLRFSKEDLGRLDLDEQKSVWFTCDTV